MHWYSFFPERNLVLIILPFLPTPPPSHPHPPPIPTPSRREVKYQVEGERLQLNFSSSALSRFYSYVKVFTSVLNKRSFGYFSTKLLRLWENKVESELICTVCHCNDWNEVLKEQNILRKTKAKRKLTQAEFEPRQSHF